MLLNLLGKKSLSSCLWSKVLNIGGKLKISALSRFHEEIFPKDAEKNSFCSAKYVKFEHIQKNYQITPES